MLQLSLLLLLLFSTIHSTLIVKIRNKCRIAENADKLTYHAICNKNNYEIDDLPRNLTSLRISGNDKPVLAGAPFRNLSSVKFLNLATNKLRILAKDAFEGLHQLEELVLKDNFIKSIDEDLFSCCPQLMKVDFSANFVIRLITFAKALAPLTKLSNVDFARNVLLQTIDENDLKPLSNSGLSHLNFEECQLRNFGKGAFSHLRNLKKLTLATNPLDDEITANSLFNISTEIRELDLHSATLTKIPTKTLEALSGTKLQWLDLKRNRFWNIEQGAIPPLPNLRYLNLRQCDIEKFKGVIFANLTSLEELDVSYNRLFGIYTAFFTLKTLKILRMNNNQDFGYPKSSFDLGQKNLRHMVNLEELHLNSVTIELLTRNNLHGLTKLKSLYLDSSVLDFEENAFESLHNLQKLILKRCILRQIIPNLFNGLYNLRHLDLESTELSYDANVLNFADMPNLEVFILAGNALTLIPYSDIQRLKKLDLLDLKNNAIIPWTEPIFYGRNLSLKLLHLKSNNLDQITEAMLKDFGTLDMIDISLNPYNCSKCSMHEFGKWLGSRVNNKTQFINYHYMTCTNPNNSRGHSIASVPLHDYCIVDELPFIIAISTSLSIIGALLIACAVIGYKFRWYFRYYWFLTHARIKRMKSISAADSFSYDAFISYNVCDQDWLLKNLLPKLELEEPKFKLCLHERDFIIGKEIISNIVESIDNSRFIVLLLSKNFLSSQWCTWEMNMAQFMSVDTCRDALILIMLEPIKKKDMSATLKYLIKTRTYLEWTDNVQGQKLFWERLKFAMQRPAFNKDQPHLI